MVRELRGILVPEQQSESTFPEVPMNHKKQAPIGLHDLLKRELKVRFNREIQIGRLRLTILTEPTMCEGICTPETDEEYQARPGPPSPDYVVRGFCGPRVIGVGETVVKQTKSQGFEYPIDQTCCLSCAITADVVRIAQR